jgi:glycosyltransferase involved in cell wall biosynthesis
MPDEPSLALDAIVSTSTAVSGSLNTVVALRDQPTPLRRIYVIDNDSTDGSAELLRLQFPDVVVHAMGRNAGLTVARSAGLRLSDAPFVLLLDQGVFRG